MTVALKPFNLIWFSLVSLVVVAFIAVVLASLGSRYVFNEAVQRDALVSAQFIQAVAEAEMRHARLGGVVTMGEFFDRRLDAAWLGVSPEQLVHRDEFFDHVRMLPEALEVSVVATDRIVVWSTSSERVGQRVIDNPRLERAFQSRRAVAEGMVMRGSSGDLRVTPPLLRRPTGLQLESFVPIFDHAGEVVSVVEIHKEPESLLEALRRAHLLLWLMIGAGAALLYVGLFWIVQRGAVLLKTQQRQLVESETLVALGGMSAAVAHGLRSPLTLMRTRAEKALQSNGPAARENVGEIIGQVDVLSRWVRELLLYARPLAAECEAVDLARAVGDALRSFDRQIGESDIQIHWFPRSMPLLPKVVGHSALLAQALASVFANAIDAMPAGGELRIAFRIDERRRRVHVTIADTGHGMSPQQLAVAFKPFQATNATGVCIGFALVKRVMERFGGKIRLKSEPGAGTEVELVFRMADAADSS